MKTVGSVASSRATIVALIAIANLSSPILAQTPPSPNPRDALAFYEGSWAVAGKINDDEREETCSWLSGNKGHIVCRASRKVAGEIHETISFYSYDETSREYVYHWFGREGDIFVERGQRIPNGFQFSSEEGSGTDKVRSRFKITEAEGGRVHTVEEKSKAGGPWVVEKKTDYIRTRP
jgi:hypothetical protein